jgi:sortase A
MRRIDRNRGGSTSIVPTVTEPLVADDAGQTASSTDHDPASPKPSWRERRRQRVSKWDRPPDPHDWRYFVGTTGKVLITTGLLMFGFVAYQLWGTGIETTRIQHKIGSQFERQLPDDVNRTVSETTVAPSVVTEPTTEQPSQTEPDTASVDVSETADNAASADASSPVQQDIPPIVRGEAFARMEIPRIDKVVYIVPGVEVNDLKKGPGHYPDTPLPGQLGNAAIAGHRTTWDAPFANIDQLEPGDEIIVTMANGDTFVYDVSFTEIVAPEDSFVIATSDPTVAMLTLTTCHPKYTTKQRMAVHAILDADKSAAVGIPTEYELERASETTVVPTAIEDDPVVTTQPVTTQPVTTQPVTTQPIESSTASDVPSAISSEGSAEAVEPVSDSVVAEPAPEAADAFGRGWFHDRAAFPQIGLWGLALIALAVICRKVSRKTRHDTIGILVTLVPFVIALYFFYQNINRLLPPGL